MKNTIVFMITILFSALFIYVGHGIATENLTVFEGQNDTPVAQAVVTKIISHTEEEVALSETESYTYEDIVFEAEVIRGEDKGEILSVSQNLNTYILMQLKPVEVGDKIVVYNYPDETLGTEWSLGEYQRTDYLLKIGIIFCILLILFGRKQGFNTLISLIFTLLSVFIVFIPAILSGQNIYIWSLVICSYMIIITLLLVSGAEKKSLVAGIGCFCGIILSALLTLFFNASMHLTGFIDEDSAYLMMINPEHPIDLKGIIFAAILIGALGAIMDVAMSISSSLYEVKSASHGMSKRDLFRAGMTIGRDIMGTMSNTLILAYIGGSLSFVLLIVSFNASVIDILNREMIITEILQALIGSIGILFTIPFTSILAGIFFHEAIPSEQAIEDSL